ncbi:hypothetical protein OCOL_001403 [Ordospora colligata]
MPDSLTVGDLQIDAENNEETQGKNFATKFLKHAFTRVDGIFYLIFFIIGVSYTGILLFTKLMEQNNTLAILGTDKVVKVLICTPIILMVLKIIYLMQKHLRAFGFKQAYTGKFIVMSSYFLTLLVLLLLILSGKLELSQKTIPIGISVMTFLSMVVSNEFVEFRKKKDRNYVDYFIIAGAILITIDYIFMIVNIAAGHYYTYEVNNKVKSIYNICKAIHMFTIFALLAIPLLQNFICEVDALFEETTDQQFQILNILCIMALVCGTLAIILKSKEIFGKDPTGNLAKKIYDAFANRKAAKSV